MKRYFVAAGALLLGTSALALGAGTDMMGQPDKGAVEHARPADAKPAGAGAAGKPGKADKPGAKLATASASESTDKAKAGDVETAADRSWPDKNLPGGEASPKVETAAYESGSGDAAKDGLDMASADQADQGTADRSGTVTSGPIEGEDAAAPTTLAGLTPQPATQNYPACNPGPGDDSCIQLYEPGVRAQLASWDRPTGGFAGESTATAMGGPEEPIAGEPVATASAQADEPATGIEAADEGLPGHEGMGGPVEEPSDYPLCSPGPGDDRCIQR